MSYNYMSRHVPIKEHQFEYKEQLSEDNINEIIGDDISHRIEDAQLLGERIGKRKIQEEYKERKKKFITTIIGIVICIIYIIISACIYTFLKGKYEHIDVMWFSVVVLGALATIVKCVLDEKQNNSYRENDECLFEGARKGYIIFKDGLFRNNLLTFCILAVICLGMGGLAGELDIVARIAYASKAFAKGFVTYGEVVNDEQNDGADEVGVLTETVEIVMQRYEGAPNEITNIKVSSNDKNLLLRLSDKERNEVFFQEKDIISDWDDQQKLNEEVLQWISGMHAEGLENRFDDFAPQPVKDEISEASRLEKVASSFGEVKNVSQTREDVYVGYPKKSIANLISNDYHRLALILLRNKGQGETILYLYSQSILWDFEVIKYTDVSDSTMKDRLNRIAQRYEDMSLVCTDCEDVTNYATKLQLAFENAADQY